MDVDDNLVAAVEAGQRLPSAYVTLIMEDPAETVLALQKTEVRAH